MIPDKVLSNADQKQSEHFTSEDEQRFIFYVDHSPMAVIEWDANFIVTRWAGEAERIFGWNKAETVGKPIMDLRMIYEEDIPLVESTMAKLGEGTAEYVVSSNRNYRKDGTVIHCQWYNTILSDTQQRMKSVLSHVLDITAQKDAEYEIRQLNAQLERKVAERTHELEEVIASLKYSEQRYRSVVEDQTEVIARYSREDGTFTFVNDVFCRYFGKSRDELLGKKWQMFAYPEDLPRVRKELEHLCCDKNIVAIENRVYNATGDVRWMQFINRCITNDLGQIVEIQSVGRDITERKQIEKELRTRKERFKFLISATPAMIYTCRAFGDYGATFVSDNVRTLLGYDPGQFVDDSFFWANNIHPEDKQYVFDNLLKLSTENYHTHEYRFRHKDGTWRWMLDEVHFVRDADGNPVEIIGSWLDITPRKHIEQALQASEERYRRLFEVESDAVVMFNALSGQFMDMNSSALTLYGYHKDEFLALDIAALSVAPHIHNQLLETGQLSAPLHWHRKKDGTIFPVEVFDSFFEYQGQTVAVGVIRDVTERMHREVSLRSYARRLVETDEELRRHLSAELHDEIANDLAATSMRIAMMRDMLPYDVLATVSSHLDDSQTALVEMNRKVRNLMAKLRPPVLDDYGLPAALRWHCEKVMKFTDQTFILDFADNFPRLASVKELALFRIYQEAITNSVKHAQAHTITISLKLSLCALQMEIIDDGSGFDINLREQRHGLSGWGLILMRERAESVGGKFLITSVANKGTSITVTMIQEAPCR